MAKPEYLPEVMQAAAKQLCIDDLDAFAERAFRIINPGTSYEWNWHIGAICEYLEACYRGEIKNLIINLPPRHLKSFLVSVAFPAWVLGKKPFAKFIMTSYKFELAKEMSQHCRSIIEDEFYQAVFPATRLSQTQAEKHNFETTAHGQYYASSITSVTGKGADYVLCDDPLKPDEALSETVRKSTNDAIRNTLFSRFNDRRTGIFILIMQRLHEDDPTGNLARDLVDNKTGFMLKLPAETKSQIVIPRCYPMLQPYVMRAGSILFPARQSREMLDKLRIEMTEYNYAGQYLQEPVPIGGGEFRDQWVQYYGNGDIQPKTMNIAILCDPSAGEEINKRKQKSSDFTAMMVVGLAPDNNYYLLDLVRDRFNPTERVETLFMLHRKWNALAGKPPKVGYEKYALMSDTHYVKEKQKQDGYRFPLVELGGQVKKETRIRRLIPDMQQGRWYFPENLIYVDNEGRRFDLVRELVYSEMPTFPRARFDDMIDAMSRIYDEDMNMVFPKLRPTERQKMIASAMTKEDNGNWMDF